MLAGIVWLALRERTGGEDRGEGLAGVTNACSQFQVQGSELRILRSTLNFEL